MVDMPESRPYHHGDLRAALLAAAERTLRDKGVGSSHCVNWPARSA